LDYTINDIDRTYTITGNNNFTANSNFTIPDFVTVNNKEYSVTTISNSAFYECTGLKGVNFGSVTTINDNAFSGCTGLTTIDFGSVTSMGEYAF
jgi:flagellar hook assembly protein FlgD